MGMFNPGGFVMDAATIASGGAFLQGELEKRHMEINEPLAAVTWQRDMPVETGGGFVEYVSSLFVDYASAGTNQHGIINGATTVIPIIQANLSKDLWTVFPWSNKMLITFLDMKKIQQTGKNLNQILEEGIQLAWNKTLDYNVYFGYSEFNTYGLVNNPSVSSGLAATGASTYKYWAPVNGVGGKTPTEILTDVNNALKTVWAAGQYADDAMPNQINIPPTQWSYIAGTPISSAGTQSIMSYLEVNNIAAKRGFPLNIVPCRQCIGAGVPLTTGGANTDRMVVYQNNKKRLQFEITQPIFPVQTEFKELKYETPFMGLFSQTQFKYLQTISYVDGI